MYVCCTSGVVDIEAKTPHETCTYVGESCIRGHHVSKDFCTPVINEVASYAVVVKMGSFGVGHTVAQLYNYIVRFYYRLELLWLVYGTAVIIPTTYSRVVEDRLLHFFVYGCSAC